MFLFDRLLRYISLQFIEANESCLNQKVMCHVLACSQLLSFGIFYFALSNLTLHENDSIYIGLIKKNSEHLMHFSFNEWNEISKDFHGKSGLNHYYKRKF